MDEQGPVQSEEERRRRRTWVIGGLVALLAVAWGLKLVGALPERDKPIYRQNCAQLAATYAQTSAVIGSRTAALADQRRAIRDAEAIDRRISQLGGCPQEPSLS